MKGDADVGWFGISEFENLLIRLSKSGHFLRADIFEFLLKEAEKVDIR